MNVSPTKSEVHFLDQEDIIELICEAMQKKLSSANQSRTFNVQTLLPGTEYLNAESSTKAASSSARPSNTNTVTRLPPQKLVRTDAKAQTLDSMNFTSTSRAVKPPDSFLSEKARGKRKASEIVEVDSEGREMPPVVRDAEEDSEEDDTLSKYRDNHQPASIRMPKEPTSARRTKIPESACDLTSIQELRAELTKDKSQSRSGISIFVDCTDF